MVAGLIFAFFSFACEEEEPPVYDPTSGNNTLTSEGCRYKVDGVLQEHDIAKIQAHNPVEDYLILTLPSPIDLQLRMLENKTGTQHAGEGESQYRLVDVWYFANEMWYYANEDVGEAKITLTDIGTLNSPAEGYDGFIKGTFSATVVNEAGDSIEITDGVFYCSPL